MSLTLSEFQLRTLSSMRTFISPVCVFTPVPMGPYAAQSLNEKIELFGLVAAGLLSDDSKTFLNATALAKGFLAFTLTERGFEMFSDSSTPVVQ